MFSGNSESRWFSLSPAARAGLAIVFGLELPEEMRERVEVFLASGGSEEDRQALLAGPRWQADYQDGRTSHAMVDLIDGLRRLRRGGHSVRVALFDASSSGGGQQRDRRMAAYLAPIVEEAEEAFTVALTGNVHSRITAGTRWDPKYQPMGYLLGKETSFEQLISIGR